jgi:hypothetical protein
VAHLEQAHSTAPVLILGVVSALVVVLVLALVLALVWSLGLAFSPAWL